MELQLESRGALVTGSSGGIGTEIARTLASEGARVAVHGRSEERAERVAEGIREAGGDAIAVLGDLATDREAEAVGDAVEAELGAVDVLVNNVGAFQVQPWKATDVDGWRRTLEANLLSTVRMCRRFVPGMRERGWGRLVQVASVSATIAPPPLVAYAAAKAGILNLTVALAKELSGTGVTSNAVSPGPVVTESWRKFAGQLGELMGLEVESLEELVARLLEGPMANPCGRLGRPEDVAPVVAFLASPVAGYVNGVNLRVDGGLVGTAG